MSPLSQPLDRDGGRDPHRGPAGAPTATPPDTPAGVGELLFRAVADAVELVSERLALAEDELRIEIGRLRSVGVGLAACAVALFVGVQLLSAAAVVLLTHAGLPLWAALALPGAAYVLGGGAFLWWRLEQARAQGRPFELTRRELERDRQWIASRRS